MKKSQINEKKIKKLKNTKKTRKKSKRKGPIKKPID